MNKLENISNTLTKETRDDFKNEVIGLILDGQVDPLEMELRLRAMEKAIKDIRGDVRVKNAVMDVAPEYNKQEFMGAGITITERKTADYSNDPVHTTLKAELKAREALLKATKGVDPNTGEIVVNYKVTEVLTIKLK